MIKICKKCQSEQNINNFGKTTCNGKLYYRKVCKNCINHQQKIYRSNNDIHLRKIKLEYYYNNKSAHAEYYKIYNKNRRLTDCQFKLKGNISKLIHQSIKKAKNKESCSKYLLYNMNELKEYLESLFEPWMNWSNWGRYNSKTWDDNDQSTWTWQIDHIIPHSTFKYTSMEDEEFKKCWALDNLRPYSAKQNIIEGTRTRHKKAA